MVGEHAESIRTIQAVVRIRLRHTLFPTLDIVRCENGRPARPENLIHLLDKASVVLDMLDDRAANHDVVLSSLPDRLNPYGFHVLAIQHRVGDRHIVPKLAQRRADWIFETADHHYAICPPGESPRLLEEKCVLEYRQRN